MALTLQDLIRRGVHHRLGRDMHRDLDAKAIVNEAGEYFVTCHSWKFLQGASAELLFVESQDFVELPDNFQSLVSVKPINGLNRFLAMTTLTDLNDKRTRNVTVTWPWYVAVAHHQPSGGGEPVPRLEIYPTPTLADQPQATGLVVFYRSGWNPLDADDDKAVCPRWAESLLIALVRDFAAGYDMEAEGNTSMLLAQTMTGPLFISARRRDAMVQGTVGRPENGITSDTIDNAFWYRDGPVSAPQ